jgi:hypothetical protein
MLTNLLVLPFVGSDANSGTNWTTLVTTVFIGLLSAGAALGGVLMTQRSERKKASLDRTLQRNTTAATLRTALYKTQSDDLREALAEYMTLEYKVHEGYSDAMREGLAWPGDMYDDVDRESVLFSSIRLLLDNDRDTHRQLLKDLEKMRRIKSDELWIDLRDQVINSATKAFSADSSEILSLLVEAPQQNIHRWWS